MKKKKLIILEIRRHYGELDWLFPLLHRFREKNYEIFTYFNEIGAYKNLLNNRTLYLRWKKICKKFYIQKKTDKFLWKLVLKIFLFLNKNFGIFENFTNFLSKKVYNLEKVLNHYKINDLKLFFTSNNNYSNLYKHIQNMNIDFKIIRFPTSQHVRFLKSNKSYLKSQGQKIFFGHKYLFRYEDEAKIYFGKFYKKNNIIFCGNMKYENWWLKKLFQKKLKKNNKRLNILVATRGFFSDQESMMNKDKQKFNKDAFDYTIRSILKISKNFKNVSFIFKTHPSNLEFERLNEILHEYKNTNYTIEKDHAYELIKKCDLAIVLLSSVCLDIISNKKPVIEFWLNKKFKFGLIKKNHKYLSSYELNNLVKNVSTYEELIKMINKFKNKEYYNKITSIQYSNFLRVNKLKNYDSKKTFKQILN
jgi:hypothetical protein